MAILRFRRTAYDNGGGNARDRIEYITRQPEHALERGEQQLRYIQEGREDLVYTNSRNLPEWAAANPHTYFKAAETYEGKTRVAFEEWKIALPRELSHRQNMALTRDLVDAIAGDTLPITYAFHDPVALDGAQQPHLHLLISARRTDEHVRTPAQHFRKFNRAHPERGGAEKDPAFWHLGAVKAWRVLISDMTNMHLEAHGLDARVHPDTLKSRGIERDPEPKLWPSESAAYRDRGAVSERMQQVLDIRARSTVEKRAELRQTWAYWLQRQEELGITKDMPLPERLACARYARAFTAQFPPGQVPSLEALRNFERAQGLEAGTLQMPQYSEAYLKRQERTQQIAQQRKGRMQRPGQALEAGMRQLAEGLRRAARHAGAERMPTGPGLHPDLTSREWDRERDRGMGW